MTVPVRKMGVRRAGIDREGRQPMSYARRSDDAPPEQPDLAGLAAKAADTGRRALEHVARVEALLEAAEAGAPLPDWLGNGRLILLLHGLRQVGASEAMVGEQLKRLSLEQSFNDMVLASAEGSGFRQGITAAAGAKHRHRRDRKPAAGQLSLIPGGKWTPAAMSGPAVLAAFRHAATAKGAAITTSAAAAAVAVTVSTSGFTTLPMTAAAPATRQVQAFGGLAPADAIPLGSLPSPRSSYAGRHRAPGAPDARKATLAPSLPPADVTVSPSSSAPSAEPLDRAYGTLNVGTIAVTVGLSGTGAIVFTAVGGALQWHASASSGLSLSSSGGILGKGQSVSLTVSVSHGTLAGAGSVTIWAGGQQVIVPVTWVTLPGLGL